LLTFGVAITEQLSTKANAFQAYNQKVKKGGSFQRKSGPKINEKKKKREHQW